MKLKLTQLDPYTCSLEELEIEIKRLNNLKQEKFNLEQSIKIFINSIYGALASPYFVGYNINAAEAVTLQGQDMIHFTTKILDDYFLEQWHLDTETHHRMGLTKVNQIQDKTITIYGDTDSVAKDTIIKTSSGSKKIENWYNEQKILAGETLNGHESVKTTNKILNWSEDKGLYYAPVKRIIRHKVSKPKWKLKTKQGKEVIITNDHSLIIFRNNKKIEIKPKDIKNNDKIIYIGKHF